MTVALNQMAEFKQTAARVLPNLSNTITTKQIKTVLNSNPALKYPDFIINQTNRISRGVFRYNIIVDNNLESIDVSIPTETPEQIDTRIKTTYENMEVLINSVVNGATNSMVVSGSAGIGKSYGVHAILDNNPNITYQFVKGYVKPTGIYKLLYENRGSNQVLVFDDADSIIDEVVGLNLLKAALELKKSRTICWFSEKEFISDDGTVIPNYFDYCGKVIFLTNLDFYDLINKNNKISPHLEAIESRTIYLDLKIRSSLEKIIRIKQVVNNSSMLEDMGIYDNEAQELLEYLIANQDRLREISLRTVEKLASLFLASTTKWRSLADTVLLR